MLVRFSSKDAKVYAKDRAYMEKKLEGRLARYFDEQPEVFVKITEEKLGFKAEITLPYYGYNLRAESSSKDGLYAAFDKAVDVIEKRMTKHKDKVISRKAKGGIDLPAPKALDDEFNLVRVKRYELKPMSVSEATLNMEMLGHDFFVFLDEKENKVCTLYKRKNGGYGLLIPEVSG